MKASDFSYENPNSLNAALALLANQDGDVQLLAGGQSLMPMMNFRLAAPDTLVDLNGVKELQFIQETETSIEIGAMTRYVQLEQSPLVTQHIPLFAKALPHIAHSAIRNRGTIGGSAALADPAAEMPALLIALGATLNLQSLTGQRSVLADDFFLGLYETTLADGEIIESISIPKLASTDRTGFYELARRHGDYAMAGVAVVDRVVGDLASLRVVFFAISDRPVRDQKMEDLLQRPSANDEQQHLKEAIGQLEFHGDLNADAATKQHLAGVVLNRALKEMET